MTVTDPTTRDPAASLARCQSLIQAAGERCASGFAWGKSHALGVAAAAAIEFVSDAAPALLAEVELVRSGLRNRGEYIEGQPPLPLALVAYDHMKRRAEAAEQVAREYREAFTQLARECDGIKGIGSAAIAMGIREILAHHGARTGESNEA